MGIPTGSGSPLIRLLTKACFWTSATSLPLVSHSDFFLPILALCSADITRLLPQLREQNSPRFLWVTPHLGQVFSLYATVRIHIHNNPYLSSYTSTTLERHLNKAPILPHYNLLISLEDTTLVLHYWRLQLYGLYYMYRVVLYWRIYTQEYKRF